MNGILLVDKPSGWTSHDVVAKVRSILRQEISKKKLGTSQIPNSKFLVSRGSKIRVGHSGTLDPAATGLLVLVIGSYTKRAGEFSKLDKTYEAEITLGATSTTGDSEGEITKKGKGLGHRKPTRIEVEEVLKGFLGQIEQTPHPYSAVKVGGQRAYALARKGKKIQLEPRQVTVYRLQVTEYKYPKLKLVAHVSSGTYIRSLAEDIGQKLGTGAYLSALRRTQVGDFSIKGAMKLEEVTYKLLDLLQ